jgi:hypothetical protein
MLIFIFFWYARNGNKCLLVFIILLTELRIFCDGLQLNCRYKYYPDVGYSCEIINATISDQGEHFEFGGNKLENRKIKTLLFKKVSPNFVPKETFEAFPQLDGIGIYYTDGE